MTGALGSVVNWTTVLVYGVPAYIAAFAGVIAAIRGTQNRNAIQTPSGDSIGHVAERTHDLTAVNAAALSTTASAGLERSVARINDDPSAPVTVDEGQADNG